MNKYLKNGGLYFITDSALSKNGIFKDVEDVIKAGCGIIQYREKNKSSLEMLEDAQKLKEICLGKALFLINDRIDIALVAEADGVHLGQGDMPYDKAREILGKQKIIGLSTGTLEQAIEAEKLGADYIGVGPIYKTSTKFDARKPCGIELIKEIRQKVSLPIIAIGGINKKNVSDVINAGANGAAVISAILKADDVFEETKGLLNIIKK